LLLLEKVFYFFIIFLFVSVSMNCFHINIMNKSFTNLTLNCFNFLELFTNNFKLIFKPLTLHFLIYQLHVKLFIKFKVKFAAFVSVFNFILSDSLFKSIDFRLMMIENFFYNFWLLFCNTFV
jgi:hypothetical protein